MKPKNTRQLHGSISANVQAPYWEKEKPEEEMLFIGAAFGVDLKGRFQQSSISNKVEKSKVEFGMGDGCTLEPLCH